MLASFGRGGFILGPLGAEAESLKLAQIEFIEILGGIFLGGLVFHVVEASGHGPAVVCWGAQCAGDSRQVVFMCPGGEASDFPDVNFT